MSDVTHSVIDAAAEAMADGMYGDGWWKHSKCDRSAWRRHVSPMVAAVAPLIAAQERERAATMVDGYADAIARMSGGTVPSVIEVACSTIAAAIRGTP